MSAGIKDLEFDEFKIALSEDSCVEVYTDGSCLGNPGPGGWGCVFVYRDKRANLSGFEKDTTNNRMELMAAIMAIKAIPQNIKMTIYTDSSYVKNGITVWVKNWEGNNWLLSNGKPVKNKDLWVQLSEAITDRDIEWIWIKGHADCINNNNADFIARSAIVTSYMEEK